MKYTIKQIIEQCGGTTALSQHCKTQQQTIRKWYVNKGIPEKHWAKIINIYGDDLTPRILHELNESLRND